MKNQIRIDPLQTQVNWWKLLVFLLLFSHQFFPADAKGSLGIPGTTQTESGYDVEMGRDAICWQGTRQNTTASGETSASITADLFPNPLVADFDWGETKLLRRCASGTSLEALAPVEFAQGQRPRTKRFYNYTVHATLDLDALNATGIVSDRGPFVVAVQVIVCELSSSGFCSPFVHEQSNARLAANNITQKPDKGYRHGGTHVHSGFFFHQLDLNQRQHSFSMTVPMIVQEPGSFTAIGALQFYYTTSNDTTRAEYRYDVANALPGNTSLITYQDPPNILQVTDGVWWASVAFVVIAVAIILVLLFETIRHHKHKVLKLSQGRFLAVFLASAVVATGCTLLLNPTNDTHCRLSGPLILIPLQLCYAITFGRLWRIHAVISPLLTKQMPKRGFIGRLYQWIDKLSSCCGRGNNYTQGRTSVSLHRVVKDWQLSLVACVATLPQVVIQICALLFQPRTLKIRFNNDESVGRAECSSGVPAGKDLMYYALYILIALVVMLLGMAYTSRNLPSLFNETRIIFGSTLLSVVLMLIGFAIIAVTNEPTTSPDVQYIVYVAVVLSITLNSTVRIMLPKLQLVWGDVTVLVSKLVTDHRTLEEERRSGALVIEGFRTSGIIVNSNEDSHTKSIEESERHRETVVRFADEHKQSRATENEDREGSRELSFAEYENEEQTQTSNATGDDGIAQTRQNSELVEKESRSDNSPSSQRHVATALSPPARKMSRGQSNGSMSRLPPTIGENQQSHHDHSTSLQKVETAKMGGQVHDQRGSRGKLFPHRLLVKDDQAPPRRLVLRMVELQEHLKKTTNQVMSGLAVSHEDWEHVRELTGTLGTAFGDEVTFQWENDEEPDHFAV